MRSYSHFLAFQKINSKAMKKHTTDANKNDFRGSLNEASNRTNDIGTATKNAAMD